MNITTRGNNIVCKKTGLTFRDTSYIDIEFEREATDIYEIINWSFNDKTIEDNFKSIFSLGDRVLLKTVGLEAKVNDTTCYSIVYPEQIACKLVDSNWEIPVKNPNLNKLVIETHNALSNIDITIIFNDNKEIYFTDGDDVSLCERVLTIDKKYNDITSDDVLSEAKLVIDKKTSTISLINNEKQQLTIINPETIKIHYDFQKKLGA